MESTLRFDAEASRRVEATYLTADVVEQRRLVLAALAPKPGERVIDVGVGPGLFAAEVAAVVGPAGQVCGIDVSDAMLALAATRTGASGSAPIDLRTGTAERIPYPDEQFDIGVSTQVLEYVADIPAALAELHRVLRPGGQAVVLDTDWDSIVWRSGDDARMAEVLRIWDEHLVDPHLPRSLLGALERAGFTVAPPRVVPLLNVGYDPATYSGGLIEIVAAFVSRHGLAADVVDAWRADLLAQAADYFFSLNRYLFHATRPA